MIGAGVSDRALNYPGPRRPDGFGIPGAGDRIWDPVVARRRTRAARTGRESAITAGGLSSR